MKISAANVRNQTSSGEDDSFLAHYHKYDEIIGFLKNVSDTYPDLVDLFSIGQTYEGRDIWGITIKSKKAREQPSSILSKAFNWATGKKPKHDKEMELIMHGGQHAREWVSVVSHKRAAGMLKDMQGRAGQGRVEQGWTKEAHRFT